MAHPAIRFAKHYGTFTRPADITAQAITGLEKHSGQIRPEIVQFVELEVAERPVSRLLLPGEPARVVPDYAKGLGIDPGLIATAGLNKGDDFTWDYEHDPPSGMGTYSLIVSQAMIEHLIDPYKHVRDLYARLEIDGDLVLHTVTRSFDYHRVPIDCVRFFPDWFETVAQRMGAEVRGKFIGDGRIL